MHKIGKEFIRNMVKAISNSISPLGPGVIAIAVGEPTKSNETHLHIYELPTELLYGPLDGSEIYYGFSFDPSPILKFLQHSGSEFVTDQSGVHMLISGTSILHPNKIIKVMVFGDPPVDVAATQILNTRNSKSTPQKIMNKNIIATIAGD